MRSKLIVAFLVLTSVSFGVLNNHGNAASEAASYEYQIMFNSATAPSVQQLNDFGAQGWELVGVTESSGQIVLYLKRTRRSG